jgi:hypothetical protein
LFTCWVPLQSFSYYTSSLSKFLGALHDGSPSRWLSVAGVCWSSWRSGSRPYS